MAVHPAAFPHHPTLMAPWVHQRIAAESTRYLRRERPAALTADTPSHSPAAYTPIARMALGAQPTAPCNRPVLLAVTHKSCGELNHPPDLGLSGHMRS